MHAANLFLCLCNLLAGLLCVGLALPLVRGRVKPNAVDGARTRRTLASEQTWYRVNAACGRWLFWLGLALAASGAAGWFLTRAVPPAWLMAALTACALLPLLCVVPLLTDRETPEADGS